MRAIKSLSLAINVALGQRDAASHNLAEFERALAFAQDQMTQLTTYERETQARWTAAAQVCATPELMRHHYQFMDRLSQAINLQETVLANFARQVEAARQNLLMTELRLVRLKQVRKQMQAKLALQHARNEQKQMDEFAAVSAARCGRANFEKGAL